MKSLLKVLAETEVRDFPHAVQNTLLNTFLICLHAQLSPPVKTRRLKNFDYPADQLRRFHLFLNKNSLVSLRFS